MEPGGKDLDDEELVHDFRERPRRGVNRRNATEGDALIGTVVPLWGELDVLEGMTRVPQPVPERWVELGGRRREDRRGEYNSQTLQSRRERPHICSSARRVRQIPAALSGKRNPPRVEDERSLVCKDGDDIGIEGETR
jgi:hypothetical protein